MVGLDKLKALAVILIFGAWMVKYIFATPCALWSRGIVMGEEELKLNQRVICFELQC